MFDMKQGEIDVFFLFQVSYSYWGWGVMFFGSDDEILDYVMFLIFFGQLYINSYQLICIMYIVYELLQIVWVYVIGSNFKLLVYVLIIKD